MKLSDPGARAFFRLVFSVALREPEEPVDPALVPALLEAGGRFGVYPLLAASRALLAVCSAETASALFERACKISRRCALQEEEYRRVSAVLCERGIPFFPMKGMVIRSLYPADTRSSTDVDVCYDPSRRAELRREMKKLGYTLFGSDPNHDMFSKKFIEFEMHQHLFATDPMAEAAFGDLLERTVPVQGTERRMTPEDNYLFCLYHAKKHLITGDLNLFALTDLLVMQKFAPPERAPVDRCLSALGLTAFEAAFLSLAEAMAGRHAPTPDDEALFDFAFEDRRDRQLAYSRYRHGGSSAGFVFQRLFPPLSYMREKFPVLSRAPILLPLLWCFRIVRFPFSGKKAELRDDPAAAATFEKLGL